jgi:hypothetical protein
MTKCAICGDEITGKGKKLETGETICKECLEESCVVVECEECGAVVWAKDAVNIYGTKCLKCHRKSVEEIVNENFYPTKKELEESWEEEFTEARWIEYLHECLEEITEWEYKTDRRIATQIIRERIEATAKAA